MLTPKQYDTLTNMMDSRDKAVYDLHSELVDRNTAAYAFVDATNALEQFILSLVPDTITTDEADGWVEWGGDVKRPVASTQRVQVKFRNGEVHTSPDKHHYEWRHFQRLNDIIAYRIV